LLIYRSHAFHGSLNHCLPGTLWQGDFLKERNKMKNYLNNLDEETRKETAAVVAQFKRSFAGLESPVELKAALIAADKAGQSWPAPSWLRKHAPAAMKDVQDGWATWREPAPEGALVLRSEEEQRLYCGDRWFLFPDCAR
jgi:hypothetical protein